MSDLDQLVGGITDANRHDEHGGPFEPRDGGEAKGRGHTNLLIIGELDDGTLWVSSAANAGEALVLMEKAKRQICFGE